jgi:hypothetical protein
MSFLFQIPFDNETDFVIKNSISFAKQPSKDST